MSMKRTCPISRRRWSSLIGCRWLSARATQSSFARRRNGLARSLRERGHRELDLAELVGGLADFAQERQPPRVGVDFVEQAFRNDFAESWVVVTDCFIEPLERLVGIAAESVDVGDVVGHVLLVFRDRHIKRV